jgi:type IV pilus assembly protein PilB
LRVSTLPTQFGESVVLRVLDRSVVSLTSRTSACRTTSTRPSPTTSTSPTASSSSPGRPAPARRPRSIPACAHQHDRDKLLTAEEPVEYDIDGIIQVPINEAIGNTFARVLRAFLRQDPDIMMIGEIRDLETAQIAIQASLTGHLVFSTLHTNDAAGAVTRLIDMGVEPFLISSTLEAVLGQRLVRTICDNCKTPYSPTRDLLERWG